MGTAGPEIPVLTLSWSLLWAVPGHKQNFTSCVASHEVKLPEDAPEYTLETDSTRIRPNLKAKSLLSSSKFVRDCKYIDFSLIY